MEDDVWLSIVTVSVLFPRCIWVEVYRIMIIIFSNWMKEELQKDFPRVGKPLGRLSHISALKNLPHSV